MHGSMLRQLMLFKAGEGRVGGEGALSERAATAILAEVVIAVRPWEDEAAAAGIARSEREVVADSFAALDDAVA
jgi:hypothetical protein